MSWVAQFRRREYAVGRFDFRRLSAASGPLRPHRDSNHCAGCGCRVTVRSRAVVAACGALHTPALLRRSGLDNANIGKHLKLHPVTVVMASYEDEVRPWEGVMQALYSDQHRDLDNGYGVKYETAPIPA